MSAPQLTAAEFGRIPNPGRPQELLRGVVVDDPVNTPQHGGVWGNVAFHLDLRCQHASAGTVTMRIGIVTQCNPDTVRGPDVVFLSRGRFGDGALPDEYLTQPPDAVFEVFDRHDLWSDIPGRVAEYLRFGVDSVYVLNPQTCRIHCFYQDEPHEILDATEQLVGIGTLADWRVRVARFFE